VTTSPEACVFVLWEAARHREETILADLGRRFAVADVVEMTWAPAAFSRRLTRMYGEALPPGSNKERECGAGPFLVVVAVDTRPRYGLRWTTRGLRRVNVRAAAAKRRYRRWAGGGFRVHGSIDRSEAERDLRLLLGIGGQSVVSRRWDGKIRSVAEDDVRWSGVDELVEALASATPTSLIADDEARLVVATDDVWWAAVIAGGDPPAAGAAGAELDVSIAGARRRLQVESR
jgi:hypothetical protein